MACGPRGLHAEPVPSAVKLRGRKSAAASQVVKVRRGDAGKRLREGTLSLSEAAEGRWGLRKGLREALQGPSQGTGWAAGLCPP